MRPCPTKAPIPLQSIMMEMESSSSPTLLTNVFNSCPHITADSAIPPIAACLHASSMNPSFIAPLQMKPSADPRSCHSWSRRLVGLFVGIPQKEKERIAEEAESRRYAAEADVEAGLRPAYCSADTAAYDNYNEAPPCFEKCSGSRSPSSPLIGKTSCKKYKQKKHKEVGDAMENEEDKSGKAFDKAHRMEISKDMSNPNAQVQRLGSMKSFRGQQSVQRMWWKIVKLVLLLDAIICLILFGVWLVICHGFSCMK